MWSSPPPAFSTTPARPTFPSSTALPALISTPRSGTLIDIAERQWNYIAHLLAEIESGKCRMVGLKEEAMQAYDVRRIAAARNTAFGSGCTSWYLAATGVPSSWPWSYDAFAEQTSKPKSEDYEYPA